MARPALGLLGGADDDRRAVSAVVGLVKRGRCLVEAVAETHGDAGHAVREELEQVSQPGTVRIN